MSFSVPRRPGSNVAFSRATYQVTHKAEVGHREEGSEDVQQHAVQRRHVNHHKVHVDGTDHQDDDATRNLPHPEGKPNGVSAGGGNTGSTSTSANLLRERQNVYLTQYTQEKLTSSRGIQLNSFEEKQVI